MCAQIHTHMKQLITGRLWLPWSPGLYRDYKYVISLRLYMTAAPPPPGSRSHTRSQCPTPKPPLARDAGGEPDQLDHMTDIEKGENLIENGRTKLKRVLRTCYRLPPARNFELWHAELRTTKCHHSCVENAMKKSLMQQCEWMSSTG